MKPTLNTGLRRTAWRIGVQTALLLIVSLLVVGAVLYATVLRSQNQQVAETLDQAMSQVKDNGDFDRDHDHDTGSPTAAIRVAVLAADGLHVSDDTPPGLPDRAVMDQVRSSGTTDRRTVQGPSGRYALLTQRQGDHVTQVMYSLFEQHQERERILGALALASGVGVVLSTLLGFWLARRAVRPMSDALTLQRRFVADAGHELRTPLTLLSTRAQLLRRRLTTQPVPSGSAVGAELSDQIAHDVDGIVDDTHTLAEILEELLLAADTRTPLSVERVDLRSLVAEAVAAAQAVAQERFVDLTWSSDPDVIATGTPTALTRAVTALIDNALTHAATRVDVHVAHRRKEISISVTDDGTGIAETALPRMFERFASDRDADSGVTGRRHYGLGLALVSEIVSRHGGTVYAENLSAPDHGARLTISVPAAKAV